ncbi:hypothetical protein [Enterococcus sp. 5H]|uniref:hypothetical protein n=1 Tax=Enterococcus sp. 5H TaxID=1229490 RepID=UPI0023020817|nr:hypothetical protein [Enterococcus sp. 5H]MDA9471182.1 hypothetical protein [Enterococcus sp. 5H]
MTNYYNDKERKEIAELEYSDLTIEQELRTQSKDKTIGYVSQVNDKATGEQSFVVTDKYVSPTAPLSEREKVKEVTVLYRGSTGIDKTLEQPVDVYRDWWVNDVDMAHKILTPNQGQSPQLKSSASTLKEAMGLYPNAQISVYGHSLGSMNAQYALADISKDDIGRISGGYFYQGPNVYSTLNSGQQSIADQLTALGLLYNYVDDKDLVPIGYGKGKLAVGQVIPVKSKKVSLIDQHMWGGYEYDNFGNVLLDTKGNKDAIKFETKQRIAGLSNLKKIMMKSGGGSLSGVQEIFLNAMEAKAITTGFQQTVQSEMNELKKWFQTEIDNANELWKTSCSDAETFGEHLTYSEELEALAAGNVTEASIVSEPVNEYEKSLSVLQSSESDLKTLLKNIEGAIEKQVSVDKELASYLF